MWLAIILEFGHFLSSPEIESPPLPIDARLIELPEPTPTSTPKTIQKPSPAPKKNLSAQLEPKKEPKPVVPLPQLSETAIPIKPSAEKTVAGTEIPLTQPPVPRPTTPAPDLASYIKAARVRRMAAENSDDREQPAAIPNQHQITADEKRMENIRKNLQQQGTSGIFQIISIGVRTARFSFRGWTTDYNNSRREIIEVDAGVNGDIERAIIRKMIELIRNHYKEDFNWESQRLNRVIVLSARMEDNDGLEDFLIREFFGSDFGFQIKTPSR